MGHNSRWLQPGTPAIESATCATISAVAGARVDSLDYTWTHGGEPQDGRILLAIDDAEGVHMPWCDSFHMDAKTMVHVGDRSGEVIAATGSYRAPDSKPWGWRIEVEPRGTDALQLRMCSILPRSMGGMEALAVQADHHRG